MSGQISFSNLADSGSTIQILEVIPRDISNESNSVFDIYYKLIGPLSSEPTVGIAYGLASADNNLELSLLSSESGSLGGASKSIYENKIFHPLVKYSGDLDSTSRSILSFAIDSGAIPISLFDLQGQVNLAQMIEYSSSSRFPTLVLADESIVNTIDHTDSDYFSIFLDSPHNFKFADFYIDDSTASFFDISHAGSLEISSGLNFSDSDIIYSATWGSLGLEELTDSNHLDPGDWASIRLEPGSYTFRISSELSQSAVYEFQLGEVAAVDGITIIGTFQQNARLEAVHTGEPRFNLGTYSYQWIDSATDELLYLSDEPYFILSQEHVGLQVFCRALLNYDDGRQELFDSDVSLPIANLNDPVSGHVDITGDYFEGEALTASAALVDLDGISKPIYYQWQSRSDSSSAWINRAIADTYSLQQPDVGNEFRVIAFYEDDFGFNEQLASSVTDSIANINDSPSGSVLISGLAEQHQLVSADHDLFDEDGLGPIKFEWQRNSATGIEWNTIALSSEESYRLTQADVGHHLRVIAHYEDLYGFSESVASSPSSQVLNINDEPTGSLFIFGSAFSDEILALEEAFDDLDGIGSVSYQWQRRKRSDARWNSIQSGFLPNYQIKTQSL